MTINQPSAKPNKIVNINSLLANRNFLTDERLAVRVGSVITMNKENSAIADNLQPRAHVEEVETITIVEHDQLIASNSLLAKAEGEKIGYQRGYEDAMQLIARDDQIALDKATQHFQDLTKEFMGLQQGITQMQQELLAITQENIIAIINQFIPEFLAQRTEQTIINEIRAHFRQIKINQAITIHCHPEFAPTLLAILNKSNIASEKYEIITDNSLANKRVDIEYYDGGIAMEFEKYDQLLAIINQYMANIKNAAANHHQYYDNLLGSLAESFGEHNQEMLGEPPTNPNYHPHNNHLPMDNQPSPIAQPPVATESTDAGAEIIKQYAEIPPTTIPDSQMNDDYDSQLPAGLAADLVRRESTNQPIMQPPVMQQAANETEDNINPNHGDKPKTSADTSYPTEYEGENV